MGLVGATVSHEQLQSHAGSKVMSVLMASLASLKALRGVIFVFANILLYLVLSSLVCSFTLHLNLLCMVCTVYLVTSYYAC